MSTVTDDSFGVKATSNCKARRAVYLIECATCKMQYVGKTENTLYIHVCMNGYQSNRKKSCLEKPVANLFNHPTTPWITSPFW